MSSIPVPPIHPGTAPVTAVPMASVATSPPPAAPVATTSPIDPDEEASWALLNAGESAAAQARFEAALSRTPSSAGAAQGLVATLRKQRLFAGAAQSLEAALLRHPQATGLLAERIWLLLDQKRYADALAPVDALIATGLADEGIHLWKVALLRRERHFREAEAAVTYAMQHLPHWERLATEAAWLTFHQRDHEQALSQFEALIETSPTDASAWQGKVASLRKLERFPEARAAAIAGLEQCPGATGLLVERGWTAFDAGRYHAAERAFESAAESVPTDPRLKVCLAAALVMQRTDSDNERAEALCREALRQDPYLAEAYGCLGQIAFQRGRWSDAERWLRRSTELDPVDGRTADLGALYVQMGRIQDAQACFRRAIQNDPGDGFAHIQLGSLLLQQEKPKLALNEFRHALALAPTSADAHRAMAVGLIELGRLDEAELCFRRGLMIVDVPKSAGLHLALAQLLTRQGDSASEPRLYEEALKEVGKAIAIDPTDGACHFQRGVIRSKLSDLRGALHSFQQVLARDPKHLQADLNRQQVTVLLAQERKLTGASRIASIFLCTVLLAQLAALWWLFIGTTRISATVFAALLPVLLGLLVVACLLPWLSRLKLTGLEAELSVPKAKDSLTSGPKGAIRFGDVAPRSA